MTGENSSESETIVVPVEGHLRVDVPAELVDDDQVSPDEYPVVGTVVEFSRSEDEDGPSTFEDVVNHIYPDPDETDINSYIEINQLGMFKCPLCDQACHVTWDECLKCSLPLDEVEDTTGGEWQKYATDQSHD
jgi:hypothetical protein